MHLCTNDHAALLFCHSLKHTHTSGILLLYDTNGVSRAIISEHVAGVGCSLEFEMIISKMITCLFLLPIMIIGNVYIIG